MYNINRNSMLNRLLPYASVAEYGCDGDDITLEFNGRDLTDCVCALIDKATKDKEKEIMATNKTTVVAPVVALLPTRIIHSGKKTIVFWNDGTKTIVGCAADEVYDSFDAFTAALAKKMFGTTTAVKKMIGRMTVVQKTKAAPAADDTVENVVSDTVEEVA